MSTLLTPESAWFELRDGAPVIVLSVEPPADFVAGEWSVLSRLTLCIVDGPGNAGFLLPRLGTRGDLAPAGWDDAVERAAGSYVVFGTDPNAPAVFVRSLG